MAPGRASSAAAPGEVTVWHGSTDLGSTRTATSICDDDAPGKHGIEVQWRKLFDDAHPVYMDAETTTIRYQ
jgi:hypothetical protein